MYARFKKLFNITVRGGSTKPNLLINKLEWKNFQSFLRNESSTKVLCSSLSITGAPLLRAENNKVTKSISNGKSHAQLIKKTIPTPDNKDIELNRRLVDDFTYHLVNDVGIKNKYLEGLSLQKLYLLEKYHRLLGYDADNTVEEILLKNPSWLNNSYCYDLFRTLMDLNYLEPKPGQIAALRNAFDWACSLPALSQEKDPSLVGKIEAQLEFILDIKKAQIIRSLPVAITVSLDRDKKVESNYFSNILRSRGLMIHNIPFFINYNTSFYELKSLGFYAQDYAKDLATDTTDLSDTFNIFGPLNIVHLHLGKIVDQVRMERKVNHVISKIAIGSLCKMPW